MSAHAVDVVVVGAGAAGLSALKQLDRAGYKALCLEARGRIGGRVHTRIDPLSPAPIELGAEFIHGRSPEIWDVVRSHELRVHDIAESAVRIEKGKIRQSEDGWELIDEVIEDMRRAAKKGPDKSFSAFLELSSHSEDAKRLAMSYVEGFNAAHGELISVRSLAQDAEAADEIDGDRSFRFADGYRRLIGEIAAGIDGLREKLRVNSIVERIDWSEGSARVRFRSRVTNGTDTLQAGCVIVTVPLGALGAITFEPAPGEILEAARKLEFGQVMRAVFRFREGFWEGREELAQAGFLLSDEEFFPTWWTTRPLHAPVLVGWSAGPHADGMLDLPRAEILSMAVADLARISGTRKGRINELLEAAYFHNWHADPFARGAYSYVPVGGLSAREQLARPMKGTLYFAGEATELNGHSATVHGAIASGKRAAKQILERCR
ncbi:MAG: FAD-dependent oxidoreductase [Acidobacteriaceae bacterium]|nr:FAD-dependent oxidoreductase [Acidobacteriaceae bacterium]